MHRIRHRSRRRNKQRKIIIGGVCSLLLIMTVGYAAMQTNLEIKAKGNVIKKATGGEALLDNVDVVTSGDGLYKDVYEENVYTYRGANPNNYVAFNDETWRIISVNTSDNTIKIMRNEILKDRQFSISSCSISYNNNQENGIYIINNIIYAAGDISTTIVCKNWANPVELNTYLNTTYYNTLTKVEQKKMVNGTYKIGEVNNSNENIITDIEQAKVTMWKGKIGLIDAAEYVRASTNSSCTGVHDYFVNSDCYDNSNNYNWMDSNDNWWSISPSTISNAHIWSIDNDRISAHSADASSSVRPVVTLSPEVKITSGDGTEK